MKKSMWGKIGAFCMACVLMVSSTHAATEEMTNGAFSEMRGSTPLHWEFEGGAKAEIPFRAALGEGAELCRNGGFESGASEPSNWTAYWGPWNGSRVRRTSAAARTGTYGVEVLGISTDEMTVYQKIEDVVPGAEYQISAYTKIVTSGARVRLTVTQYKDEEVLRTDSIPVPDTATDWTLVYGSFSTVETCTNITTALRVNGEGKVYLDDVSYYMTKLPPQFFFETEDIFHYAERGIGTAHIKQNPYYANVSQTPTADFVITDADGKVLSEGKNIPFSDGEAKWDYSVAAFEMYEEYTLTATARGGGKPETFVQDIYKYPRPTALRADGTYIDENGKPFIPVIAYHPGDFSRMAEIGVNVVEISAPNPEATLEQLQACQALGIKALVSLFCGPKYMMPAAHPDNMNTTMAVVRAVHDHPAVFAYAVQDEPYGGEPAHMDTWLSDSYKMIHSIDKVHPVYAVDFNPDAFRRAGKRVDVLATDLYPYQANAYKVTDSVRAAVDAVYGRKPVYCIAQVFEGVGYFPTVDEVRAQIYRALMEGAHGIGFYAISNAIGHWGGKENQPLYETDRWEGMTAFAKEEMRLLLDHFAKGGNKQFTEKDPGSNAGVFYAAWEKNGKLYFAIHNRNAKEEGITIPLKSDNGSITVNGYNIKRVNPPEPAYAVSGSTLSVSLHGNACALYEITPSSPINATLLTEAVRKPAVPDKKLTSALQATALPTETERENAAIGLSQKGASIEQNIYELRADKNYLLSIEYESSVSESATVTAEFYVRDANGYNPLDTWRSREEKVHVSGEEAFEEKFGSAKGKDIYSVDFPVPEDANAIKLTILANKNDPNLRIQKVSLSECEKNLLANGSMAHVKAENRLSGGWSAYYEYPPLYKNTAEIRTENGRAFLYMTEAQTYRKGTSANARQKVALYEDKLYLLSFLYKDMGGTPYPTAGVSAIGGRSLTRSGEETAAADGWKQYHFYICPRESAMHTVWLGGPDAEGAYGFADVRLCEVRRENHFLALLPMEECTAESPYLAKKIENLAEAENENGIYDVLLWQKREACVAIYGANELVDFSMPQKDGWIQYKVPTGGKLRVFVWETGSLKPKTSSVTLK